jgi:CHAD domain-containing protein
MSSHAYRLKSEEGAAEGLRRIATGRAEKALERLAVVDEESLAAAIHGARKDLKKLRAVLRLIRKELGRDLFKAESRRYRDAGRLLAGSRDAEVKLETLRALRGELDDNLAAGSCPLWEQALERERDEIAAGDGGSDKIDEAAHAIEGGRDRIRDWRLRTDSWKLLEPGLSKGYRDGRWAMKQVLADPSTENVHRWRKRAKDHWYQLRILHDAWPELLGETAEQAHALADRLGEHHDLAVLELDLRSRTDLGERGAFEAAIAQRQEELLEAALDSGRRLYAEKPKPFRRRLERYWLAWRGA